MSISVHPEEQTFLKWFLLERLQLGSKHELKLRPPSGRKTFSFRGINGLLQQYIHKIRLIKSHLRFVEVSNLDFLLQDREPHPIERLDDEFPLCPEFAKQWMDEIWKLLLQDFPQPETHPQLKRLGSRASRTDRAGKVGSTAGGGKKASRRDIRSTIRESQPNASGYIRNGIKDTLQRYLVRMLRKTPDK